MPECDMFNLGSSYFHVALTTVLHLLNVLRVWLEIECVLCDVCYEECTDSVMIRPNKSCVSAATTFTCSGADGHPGPPIYSWKELDTGLTFPGATYTLRGSALHRLQCTANYTHDFCPEIWAACHSNITVRSFGQHCI